MSAKIKKLKSTALRPESLQTFYRDVMNKDLKIIFVNNSNDVNTIEDIFENNCCVVFLPVSDEYVGHYISMWRNNGVVYVFDSYGNSVKELLSEIESMGHVTINRKIFEIIKNSNDKVYVNTLNYQTKDDNVADCGRYAVSACIWSETAVEKGTTFTLNDYHENLIQFMRENKVKDYDDAVTMITKDMV